MQWRNLLPLIYCGAAINLLLMSGCSGNKPILIGFAAELTGKRAELGVAARDGALLAVEEINRQGGINQRPLKLLVKDDRGIPEVAQAVDAELIEAGVVAIIGHTTSQQTAAALNQMNQAQIVLLSPTATSVDFSGKDDYFFRLVSSNDQIGLALARQIYQQHSIKQIVGVFDVGNRAFAQPQWQIIQEEFERLGGDASTVFTFSSGQTDLETLAAKVAPLQPEGVVLVASAIDAALIAQYLRQQGYRSQLFSSSWAHTQELLEKGGQSIEGMEMAAVYNPQNPYPAFAPFLQLYRDKFHREPDYPAVYSYEAVLTLAHALRQTGGTGKGLPQALTQVKNLAGVQGPITIDRYGDVYRDIYIVVVQNGQFNLTQTIPITP